MKYGETLRQRSILAWQTHNIDYKDVKHFIKVNTTPGRNKAVSIPGSADANAEEFENTLLGILKEQDERITGFVRSKVGEIQRRLVHLEQQISRFKGRDSELNLPVHTPVRQGRRYGRIETDILKVGEEIQALSRFVGVQLEGFRKLIKKYKKWTGSIELGQRFHQEVRNRATSFSSTDLKPFLDKYEQLLHDVRSLYEKSQEARDSQPATPTKALQNAASTAQTARLAQLRVVVDKGKRVDFDHTMATLRHGHGGKNAVFWVHPENVVEIQILLLQFTRSFNAFCRQNSSMSAASSQSQSPSTGQPPAPGKADCFDIVMDDAHAYLSRQASITVEAVEALSEGGTQRAALHARGNGKDEPSMLSWVHKPLPGVERLETCAAKRKFVDTILNRGGSMLSRKASIPHLSVDDVVPDSSEDIEELQRWLQENPQATAIATILSQRARFFNLTAGNTGAVLATLDHSISFQQGAWTTLDGWPASRFPHAVLQIRQEGAQQVDLIQVLDNSHLVERVHGFTLEHHAVWQATRPSDIAQPFWIPLLNQDLRKVPRAPVKALQKAGSDIGSQSTTPQLSTATSSETGAFSDPLTPSIGNGNTGRNITFQPKDHVNSKIGSRKEKATKAETFAPQQQYWNEYDNPSDDEDGYVIYLDPNEKSVIERMWSSLTRILSNKEKARPGENRPLLYEPDLESGSNEDGFESSDDDDEDEDFARQNYRTSRIYGSHDTQSIAGAATAGDETLTHASRAKAAVLSMPNFTLTCFFASITILIVAFLLAASGRRKLVSQVDAGVVFAVVSSLLFSVAGVVNLYRSQQQLRGVVWAMAGVTLCLVAVASGGLLAWVAIDL